MRHEPWLATHAERAAPTHAILGRVSNGIFNADQPRWSPCGRYQAWIDGEIINSTDLWEWVGRTDRDANDADLLLAMLAKGPVASWVGRCNGGFLFIIFDKQERRLTIANDRFGQHPHYYTLNADGFLFAPEIKFILSFPWVSVELDSTSLSEYFYLQMMFDDRTFFRGIRCMPYASVMTVDLETLEQSCTRYWRYQDIPRRADISFDNAAERAADLFRQAVHRQTSTPHRYGLLLSAGYDSRLILGAVPRDRYPLHAFTFGMRNSRDPKYAAELCRRLGVQHHVHYFESGEWIREHAARHASLTDGFHCIQHAHSLSLMPEMRECIDINLSGIGGDVGMGGMWQEVCPHLVNAPWDPEYLQRTCFEQIAKYYGRAFSHEHELNQMLTGRLRRDPRRANTWDTLKSVVAEFEGCPAENVLDYIGAAYRSRRMLQYFLVFARPYVEDRTPYMDYDFFDFIYSIPSAHRLNHRLMIDVMHRICEPLTRVPISDTNALPTNSRWRKRLWEQRQKFEDRARRWISPRLFPKTSRVYQDYAGWFGGELNDWLRQTLVGGVASQQGVFRPAYIESLLTQLDRGGAPVAWPLGMMVSFELMLRQVQELRTGLNPGPDRVMMTSEPASTVSTTDDAPSQLRRA